MLVSLGLDFRRARLEIRERFHLEAEDGPRIYDRLEAHGVEEFVLTRTCNRIEAYCWWPDATRFCTPAESGRTIGRAWVREDDREAELLLASARLRTSTEASRHLLRVAAGLESQVLGDIHILGQVRRAFREAVDADSVGSHLHRLFEIALSLGKKVRRETQLMASRNSVGSEAARSAAAHVGGLADGSCVVVGCGKSGIQAARTLRDLGARDLAVVNRTRSTAEALADDLGTAQAAGLDELPRLLGRARVVIVATGAPEPVISEALVRDARAARGSGAGTSPLLVIDVSVPRNIEGAVGRLPGVELIDLDSLFPEAAETERSRRAAIPEAEAIVEASVGEFGGWLEMLAARRALRPLQELLAEVCRREVSHLAGESDSSRRTADRIVASVMARPMSALRSASQRGESVEEAAGALGGLFARTSPD